MPAYEAAAEPLYPLCTAVESAARTQIEKSTSEKSCIMSHIHCSGQSMIGSYSAHLYCSLFSLYNLLTERL